MGNYPAADLTPTGVLVESRMRAQRRVQRESTRPSCKYSIVCAVAVAEASCVRCAELREIGLEWDEVVSPQGWTRQATPYRPGINPKRPREGNAPSASISAMLSQRRTPPGRCVLLSSHAHGTQACNGRTNAVRMQAPIRARGARDSLGIDYWATTLHLGNEADHPVQRFGSSVRGEGEEAPWSSFDTSLQSPE